MTTFADIQKKAHADAVNRMISSNSGVASALSRQYTDTELQSYKGDYFALSEPDKNRYLILKSGTDPGFRQQQTPVPEDTGEPHSVGAWLLDLLSRPAYAVGGVIRGVFGDENDQTSNPVARAWAGLTGQERHLPGAAIIDAIGEDNVSGFNEFLLHLGGDIALDPLTYVGVGLGTKALTGAQKLTGTVTDAERAAATIDVSKVANRVVPPAAETPPAAIPTPTPTPPVQTPAEALGITPDEIATVGEDAKIINKSQTQNPDEDFLSNNSAKASDPTPEAKVEKAVDNLAEKLDNPKPQPEVVPADYTIDANDPLNPTAAMDQLEERRAAVARGETVTTPATPTPAPVVEEIPQQLKGLSDSMRSNLAADLLSHDGEPAFIVGKRRARAYQQALINDNAAVDSLFKTAAEREQVRKIVQRYVEKTGDKMEDIKPKGVQARKGKVVQAPAPGSEAAAAVDAAPTGAVTTATPAGATADKSVKTIDEYLFEKNAPKVKAGDQFIHESWKEIADKNPVKRDIANFAMNTGAQSSLSAGTRLVSKAQQYPIKDLSRMAETFLRNHLPKRYGVEYDDVDIESLTDLEQALYDLSEMKNTEGYYSAQTRSAQGIKSDNIKAAVNRGAAALREVYSAISRAAIVREDYTHQLKEIRKYLNTEPGATSKGAPAIPRDPSNPVGRNIASKETTLKANADNDPRLTPIEKPAAADHLDKIVNGGNIRDTTVAQVGSDTAAREGGIGTVTQSRIFANVNKVSRSVTQTAESGLAFWRNVYRETLSTMGYITSIAKAHGLPLFIQNEARVGGEHWNLGIDDVFKAVADHGGYGVPKSARTMLEEGDISTAMWRGHDTPYNPMPGLLGKDSTISPSAVLSATAAVLDFRNSVAYKLLSAVRDIFPKGSVEWEKADEVLYNQVRSEATKSFKHSAEIANKRMSDLDVRRGKTPREPNEDKIAKYTREIAGIVSSEPFYQQVTERIAINNVRNDIKAAKDYAELTKNDALLLEKYLGETPEGTTATDLTHGMTEMDEEINKKSKELGATPGVQAAADGDAVDIVDKATGDLAKTTVQNTKSIDKAQKEAVEHPENPEPAKRAREKASETAGKIESSSKALSEKADADALIDGGAAPGNTVEVTKPDGSTKVEVITNADVSTKPTQATGTQAQIHNLRVADTLSAHAEAETEAVLEAANGFALRPKAVLKGINEAVRTIGGVVYTSKQRILERQVLNQAEKELKLLEDPADAFSKIARGEIVPGAEIFQKWYRGHFDPNGTLHTVLRNGLTVDQFNAGIAENLFLAKQAGKKKWQLKIEKKTPKTKGQKATEQNTKPQTLTDLMGQFKDWKVEDPTEFMAVMDKTIQDLVFRQHSAMAIERKYGSATTQDGYRQMGKTERQGIISSHIDPNIHLPNEVADMIAKADIRLAKPKDFSDSQSQIAKLINSIYDPLLSMWKQTVTIWRPGHHVRNAVGDAMLNWINAGMSVGTMKKRYAQATQLVMGKNLNDIFATVELNGVKHELTGNDILRIADEQALTPEFHLLEDLTTKEGKIYDAFQRNWLTRGGAAVSEKSSAIGRLSQLLHEIEKPSNIKVAKSHGELEAIAGTEVRRLHPDVTGLSPEERKYITRIMPFYSWWRQTLPRVAEGLITNPVRTTMPFRINYSLAQGMGEDPPTWADQWNTSDYPYPSFLLENINGPMSGGGVGFSFNTPMEGLLGSQGLGALSTGGKGAVGSGAGLLQGAMGMTSPMLRAPFELASGQNFALGSPISDTGEYVDNQLPLLGDFARVFGIDTAGTVGSMLSSDPTIDPTRAIKRGDVQPVWNPGLVNLIFGVGMTDTRKDSYMNLGMRGM